MGEFPTGTVTFLFTDIEGSARLWEEHPEAMRPALARYDGLLRAAIEAHGGHVFKTVGDAFCAVFATAADAVDAALAIQQTPAGARAPALLAARELKIRVALHTGAAEARDGDYFGPPLNRVARLLSVGHGGQVLLSQTTGDLVQDALPPGAGLRDLGQHRLRDLQRSEHLFQLLHPELPPDYPPLHSLETLPHSLPQQVTSFIGREQEIAELKGLLERTRLLTLTGAGGCGKSRLALQMAAEVLERYPDGVWLVELAPLSDASLVRQAAAAVLGVKEEPGRALTQSLVEFLKAKPLLLVLDNCEHLIPACAELADALLHGCPHLQVLTTSREGLGITGELTYRVPSLSLPAPGERLPLERLTQYEAVKLFIERAQFSQPTFHVTDQNAPAVVEICHRLDGIPLALELAAARVRALPLERIRERLHDCFRLLTGGSRTALPRQQTLRATMDWSYDLLTEQERVLLRRLSIFTGGWSLEAAEAVCTGEPVVEGEVPDLLTHLVEKSLVVYEEQDGRFRLLETVRQYGEDRLMEAEEMAMLRDRHRDYFVGLAERAESELEGRHQQAWLERLEAEHDNLRAAREWCAAAEDGVETVLRLGRSLRRFWIVRGPIAEGREWLEGALSRCQGAPPAVHAEALVQTGELAFQWGDLTAAQSLYEQGVGVFRQLGNRPRLARVLSECGQVACRQGEQAAARALYDESLALFRELGEDQGAVECLYNLAWLARERGDYGSARMLYEESAALSRRMADTRSLAPALASMAVVAHNQGDDAAARSLCEECLILFREQADRWVLAQGLEHLAWLACRYGDYPQAKSWYEESLSLFRTLGDKRSEARLVGALGNMAEMRGDYALARELHEEGLMLWRELGDRPGTNEALTNLAHAVRDQGDFATARRLLEESLAIRRELGERGGAAWVLFNIADIDRWAGNLEAARPRYEEGLEIMRRLGFSRGVAYGLHNLGLLAHKRGDLAAARSLYTDSLERMRQLADRRAIAYALERLASLTAAEARASVQDDARGAVRLLGAAEALREAIGALRAPADQPDYDASVAAARAALGEEPFAAAWAEGRAMPVEQAIACALEEDAPGETE